MPKIKANEINIYYEIYGRGEPLIMIAGFSGDHTAFDSIIEEYAKHYQVIVFDNRGAGQSDTPNYPYTIEMMAKDSVELLKALGIKRAHILGHSMGTSVAQMMAYQHPEHVKSIILINAFPYANTRARLYGEIRLELTKANAPKRSILKFIAMLCWADKYLTQSGAIDELIKIGIPDITLKGYENQLNALLSFDSRKWLHEIKAPCLIINGDDDLIVGREQGEMMANTIPNVEYQCLHDVGHVAFIEAPEKFHRLVVDFLQLHHSAA